MLGLKLIKLFLMDFTNCKQISIKFLKNNVEVIWQLESINNGFNAPDGIFVASLSGPNLSYPVTLNQNLVSEFSIEDLRRQHWIKETIVGSSTYYFPYKYKLGYTGMVPEEYPVFFRLSEQYLIRAEARAQQRQPGRCT